MSIEQDRRDLIRGAFVNSLGVMARSLNLVFFIVLGRLYGTENTGLYLLSWTFVDVTSKLGILGLDRAVLVKAAQGKDEACSLTACRETARGLVIGLSASLLLVTVILLVTPLLGNRLFDKPELVSSFRVMALGIPFWAISAVLLAATRARRTMKYEVIVKSVIEPCVMLTGASTLYFWSSDLNALMIAFVITTFAGACASVVCFFRVYSPQALKVGFSDMGRLLPMLNYSAPIGLYDMMNLGLQRIGLFVVGLHATAASTGIYAIAEEAASFIKKVRQAFDPILIPVLSGALSAGENDDAKQNYQNITRWVLQINLVVLGVVILAGERILQIFGNDFMAGAGVFILLVVALLINGALGVSELFVLIKRPSLNLYNTFGAILVNGGLCYLLIPAYGMLGAGVALCTTYLLMNIARLIQVGILFRFHPFTVHHAWAVGVFSVALLLALGLSRWTGSSLVAQVFCACVFVLVYAVLTLWLQPREEQGYLLAKLRKRRQGRNDHV